MAVEQVPGSRFARESFSRLGRSLFFLGLTSALAMASLAYAQSLPAGNSTHKDKPPISGGGAPTSTPQVGTPVVPGLVSDTPVPPTAQQLPPQPPVVNWDGSLLTIDAENSTLTDILIAVRTRTGASMEIPPSASGERVFVHLGPGPIREIVSSLLYGTGFDYIVETAEDDPNALRSLVVTVQGKGDDSAGGSLAAASGVPGGIEADSTGANKTPGSMAQGVAPREGMRMMRGWAAPGKPAFQANAEATLAAEESANESGSVSVTADGNVQNPPAVGSASASAAEEATNSNPQPSSALTASGTSLTETDLPLATQETSSSAPESDSNGQPGISHMIQNMTNLFAQRRQIQAQQNQAAQQQRSPSE